MALEHEFHSEPSHEIVKLPVISIHVQIEVYFKAFVCKSVWVTEHVCTHNFHLGTFHCTLFHLESVAYYLNYNEFIR